MDTPISTKWNTKVSAAGIETADDLLDWLQDLQNQAEPQATRRALGAGVCLVVALVFGGAVAKTALVLCFLASAAFVLTLVDYTGRRWFMHHVIFHEVIRPRPNLAVELVDAMIRLDDAAQAVRDARCGDEESEGWTNAVDDQHGPYSGAQGEREGETV